MKGFSLDCKTGVEAYPVSKGIVIQADEKPGFVYYGWKPFSDGNLVNSENLPASTFRMKVQ